MSLPLARVRVLDLTRLLPGGYATLMLSGLGADVIKIEDPASGDALRIAPPWTATGHSGPHAVLNRGKRSVAIDLKHPAGRELLLSMVAKSEVLLDSFRPGVMDRLGLTAAALASANDALVHVSIDAFGSGGPYELVPAHDLNTAGYAAVVGLARDAQGQPAMPSVPVVDHLAGLHAVVAVMVGLRETGVSRGAFRAEVAMQDAAASMLTLIGGFHAATGAAPPAPEMLSGQLACYGMYECADGEWITVGGLESKFFARMIELMGRPELAPLQYDPTAQEHLRDALTAAFSLRNRSEWLELLALEDTCVGPVNDVSEALIDPNLVARGLVGAARFPNGETASVVRSVPWLPWDQTAGESTAPDASTDRPAPGLGEHTEAVLAEYGVSSDDLARLRAEGAIPAV